MVGHNVSLVFVSNRCSMDVFGDEYEECDHRWIINKWVIKRPVGNEHLVIKEDQKYLLSFIIIYIVGIFLIQIQILNGKNFQLEIVFTPGICGLFF